jgi:hypothetical protein
MSRSYISSPPITSMACSGIALLFFNWSLEDGSRTNFQNINIKRDNEKCPTE